MKKFLDRGNEAFNLITNTRADMQMREILPTIEEWISKEIPVAIATVVSTWGSSPRPAGSVMAVTRDLQIAGSVSAGCVETEVIDQALQVLIEGRPKMLSFGVSDENAWSVGLSCGGRIRVWLESLSHLLSEPSRAAVWQKFFSALGEDKSVVWIAFLQPKYQHYLLYADGTVESASGSLDGHLRKTALHALSVETSQLVTLGEQTVFLQVFPEKPRLLIIGANHIALPLIAYARELGFRTIVIDPRGVFANADRFPVKPDKIYWQWPREALSEINLSEFTYAVLLSHDPKIDDPALEILLDSPVAYIGALGSQRTQAQRLERIRSAGKSAQAVQRIKGPVGLPLGGRSPAEIALSIMAEIIQEKNARKKRSQNSEVK